MKTKRREILDKWFCQFQLSIGNPNEPLTDHAAEYLEAAWSVNGSFGNPIDNWNSANHLSKILRLFVFIVIFLS